MHYKVILVHQQSSCCSRTPITAEIEHAANQMASDGYVLVTAYQQTASVQVCCGSGSEIGAVLVFARE
jgi:hypothetical protein